MTPADVVLLVSHRDWIRECRDYYCLWLEGEILPIIVDSQENELLGEIQFPPPFLSFKERIDMYITLLCKEIQAGYLKETMMKPFKKLIPLMELQILSMRAATRHNRAKYLEGGSSEVEKCTFTNDLGLREVGTRPRRVLSPESRQIFRRSIENFVDSNDQFVRYVDSFSAFDGLKDNHMRKLTNDFNHVLEEARRLDLEIRDCVQLNVSNASLEESKKSIEQAGKQSKLADAQFEEFKRGKRVELQPISYLLMSNIAKIGMQSSGRISLSLESVRI